MKKDYLSISKIASLVGISVDTLKHYNKIGLFNPEYVDPVTSYRHYSVKQIYTIMLIKELRNLDFSLSEISDLMKKRDFNKTVDVFSKKIEYNNKVIEKLQKQNHDLEKKLSSVQGHRLYSLYEDHYFIKELDVREIVTYDEIIRDDLDENLSVIFLYSLTPYDTPAIMQSSLGVITNKEDYKISNHGWRLFLQREDITYAEKNHVKTLPGGEYLCTYHSGSVRDSDKVVEKMMNYAEEQGYEALGDVIFLSIIDEFFTSDPKEMMYEVQIAVAKSSEKAD